jgi:predicted nucleic acid-binding Zn ribbon protein
MTRASIPPDICPVCGDAVPRNAKACPGCGADERSGWDDEARGDDALDLPEERFDHEKFQEEEFNVPRKKSRKETILLVIALVLFAAVTLSYVFRNSIPHG